MVKQETYDKEALLSRANKILCNYDKIFAVRFSESVNSKIQFDLKANQLKSNQYAMMYLTEYNMFCVWDISVHRGATHCLNVRVSANEAKQKIDENQGIWDHYKNIGNRYSSNWEKVLFVHFDHLEYFLRHFSILMVFNEFDIDYPKSLSPEWCKQYTESERKKYSTSQWKRDCDFRRKVLENYDYKCAICRCDIQEVLEAAHERGYEVRNTNTDDYTHGICLCANHHLMYDLELIDIDLKNLTVHCKNKELEKSSCFNSIKEKYGGKIIQPMIEEVTSK